METPAQVAERLGIPLEVLPELLESNTVAELLVLAREDPSLAPEAIMARLDLPICDPDGLDVPRVLADVRTLRLRRERLESIGRKGDGTQRDPDRVKGSGVMLGELQRAKKAANERLQALERIESLLQDRSNGTLPAVANVESARRVCAAAISGNARP